MRRSKVEEVAERHAAELARFRGLKAEREVLEEEIDVLEGSSLDADRGARTLLARVRLNRDRDRLKAVSREIAELEQRLVARAAERPELERPDEQPDLRRDLLRRRLAGARLELGRIKVLLGTSTSPLVRQARLARRSELERLVKYYERQLKSGAQSVGAR